MAVPLLLKKKKEKIKDGVTSHVFPNIKHAQAMIEGMNTPERYCKDGQLFRPEVTSLVFQTFQSMATIKGKIRPFSFKNDTQ